MDLSDMNAIGSNAQPLCSICGKEIQTLRFAYRRVVGWEKHRQQGGTNAIRLRQSLDEWAHSMCVDREVNRVHAGQLEFQ